MRNRINTTTIKGRVREVKARYEYRFGNVVAIPCTQESHAEPTPPKMRHYTKKNYKMNHTRELMEFAKEHHPQMYAKLFLNEKIS